MTRTLARPSLEEVRVASRRLDGLAARTPVICLEEPAEGVEALHLKLENLQPIGSFKVRGAGNAITAMGEAADAGVFTASAGNMAQGVAWCARRLGIESTVIVPDHAPATKLAAIERLGARTVLVPFDRWWRVMEEHAFPGLTGRFVHPVSEPEVIAGNGTVGLELIEQLPEVATIVVPFGGGGLSCGIAAAVKALRPSVRVVAAEVETAAPLAAALAAGEPRTIDYQPSFVDGIGGKSVLPEMWPLVRELVDEVVVVSLGQVAGAVRLLAERARVVAEGAGAASVAAALASPALPTPVVAVVSGGNLDSDRLATILDGRLPD